MRYFRTIFDGIRISIHQTLPVMKKVLLTFLCLAATAVMFAQTGNRERADETSFPEIDNLSGLKPDEDDLTPTSGTVGLSDNSTENGGTGVVEEQIHTEDYDGTIKAEKTNLVANAQVYPNPAQDYIYVTSDASDGTILVMNLLGQEMGNYPITSNSMTIDISGLKEGIYFVSITSGENTVVKKIKVL